MHEDSFHWYVIRLLVAILDRLMFPSVDLLQRDRDHQFLMSNALKLTNKEKPE